MSTMNDKKQPTQDTEMIRRTYAPIAMAMAIMMMFWGILCHPYGISIWSMSLAGGGLFAWALYSWMKEVCHEWSIQDES